MTNIGIEKNHGLVYEGDGNYGRGLWPAPMITAAKFCEIGFAEWA